MKKVFAFLLAAQMVLVSLAGCGSGETEETINQEKNPTETKVPVSVKTEPDETDAPPVDLFEGRLNVDDGLPETSFNGRDFRFLVDEKYAYQLYSEDTSGVGLDFEIYERNRRLEDRFDVKISTKDSLGKESQDLLTMYAQVGEHITEVCAYEQTMGNTPAIYFCWANWKDIPYLNFDQPWWNKASIENLIINDYCFNIAGDLSLSAMQYTWCLAFNMNLMENWGYPSEMLYDLVWDGEWTLDRLIEITSSLWNDKNGDGQRDTGDFYGFGTPLCTWDNNDRKGGGDFFGTRFVPWVTAIDEHSIVVGEDKCSLTNTLGTEKVFSALEKLVNFHNNTTGATMMAVDKDFIDGKIGIYTAKFDIFYSGSAYMDFSAGVLPMPKYDTAQENYVTTPDFVFTMFGIPVTLPEEDYELVGVIMEALNAESWKTVYPAYYEEALRGRYATDPNMARMIELITESRIYEYATLCIQSLESYGKLPVTFDLLLKDGSTDLASVLAEYDHRIKRSLAEILVFFDVEDQTGILGADYEIPDAAFGS